MTEANKKPFVQSDDANRNLGDEWEDWDGRDEAQSADGKWLFLAMAGVVVVLMNALVFGFVFMISPRLFLWSDWLPVAVWVIAFVFAVLTVLWFATLTATSAAVKNFLPFGKRIDALFAVIFVGAFRVGKLFGISRDRMGHSFVKAFNDLSRATKAKGRKEKLLILLPRCLAKDQLLAINALKDKYPIFVQTVSGGELARKKIKELRPTAVIGVACERDLVSGIRDVNSKISLIGIPNRRPEGPCKNTLIDMDELIRAIEFYVGPETA